MAAFDLRKMFENARIIKLFQGLFAFWQRCIRAAAGNRVLRPEWQDAQQTSYDTNMYSRARQNGLAKIVRFV